MDFNWLISIVYGFLSGFTAFLPVSGRMHQILMETLTGTSGQAAFFRVLCTAASLCALFVSCRTQLARLMRQRRLAMIPARKRKRQPDPVSIMEFRFLRTAVIPAVLVMLLSGLLLSLSRKLWVLALLTFLNGVLLYAPQFFRSGNKEAPTSSGLDAVVTGLGVSVMVMPGFSGVAGGLSFGSILGLDRQFSLRMSLLLLIPVMLAALLFDCITAAAVGIAGVSAGLVLCWILAAGAAFLGGMLGIFLVRFLAVKAGFSGFSYYCWGVAMFVFALYLMI